MAFALLGNSMARSILQRLVHRVLCAWGIFSGPDPWESSIGAEAARRPRPPPLKAPLAPHAGAAWARLMQALESPSRGADQPRLAAAHLTEQAMTEEVASPRLVAAGTCPVGGGCGGSGGLEPLGPADAAPTGALWAGDDAEAGQPRGGRLCGDGPTGSGIGPWWEGISSSPEAASCCTEVPRMGAAADAVATAARAAKGRPEDASM